MIGRPSLKTFLRIIDTNQLPNCPVTRDDVMAAEDILGPNLGSLKGKTPHQKSLLAPTVVTSVPRPIMLKYRDVSIAIDFMFINKIPFFMTMSHDLKFGTVEFVPSKSQKTFMVAIKHVQQVYALRGFRLRHIHGDGDFEPARGKLSDMRITLHTVSRNEHVPVIERFIRTVKERVRAMYNTVPFKRLPPE